MSGVPPGGELTSGVPPDLSVLEGAEAPDWEGPFAAPSGVRSFR
jgi:hypothetical protein